MKKVFTNSTNVIHLFAQRTQSEARCSNVFFYNDKIYSYGYHYLLGEFITNKKQNLAIIINDKGYSSTTSQHISELTQATRQYKQFFTTQTDVNIVLQTIENNVKKLQNARKKELYILPSLSLFDKLNEFINWTNNTSIKKDTRYKKIVSLIKILNGGNYSEYLKKEATRIKNEAKKEAIKQKAILDKNILDFKNHELNRIYNSETDYLRLSLDLQNVETSQGVKVTIKEAKNLYRMILDGKDIKGVQISNYTVISINGTLKIGCHNININSMHEVGQMILNN
jgi:hypothetical protein